MERFGVLLAFNVITSPTSIRVRESESESTACTTGVKEDITVVATSLVPAPPAPARLSTIKYKGTPTYDDVAAQTVFPELVTESKSAWFILDAATVPLAAADSYEFFCDSVIRNISGAPSIVVTSIEI